MDYPSQVRTPRLDQVNHEPVEPTYRRVVSLFVPLLSLFRRRDWRNQDKVPQTGPVIFVANHIGNFDPIALAEFLIYSGRWPRFLGKADIWRIPVLGWLARACGQIPVYRGTDKADEALVDARKALANGLAVVIYPEGTITADPDTWPMTGRRGAALLALSTGTQIVPIGQFGAQAILGQKRIKLRGLFGRPKLVTLTCGDPVEMSDLQGEPLDNDLLDRASVRIMDAITALVEQVRDEPAPELRYDIRKGYRVPQTR